MESTRLASGRGTALFGESVPCAFHTPLVVQTGQVECLEDEAAIGTYQKQKTSFLGNSPGGSDDPFTQ